MEKEKPRFEPRRRTALDGRTWWCVWDNDRNGWSTFTHHAYRFKTRKSAAQHIDYVGRLAKSNEIFWKEE